MAFAALSNRGGVSLQLLELITTVADAITVLFDDATPPGVSGAEILVTLSPGKVVFDGGGVPPPGLIRLIIHTSTETEVLQTQLR